MSVSPPLRLFLGCVEATTVVLSCLQYASYKRHQSVTRSRRVSLRMCVKSLVDKAAFEAVGDDCGDLDNFCAAMEHVFTHRIQGLPCIMHFVCERGSL